MYVVKEGYQERTRARAIVRKRYMERGKLRSESIEEKDEEEEKLLCYM